jgi:hypothetical protein
MSDPSQQPLFILCPGRSFSSVVSSMLGQHPELYGVPELNLFVTATVGELIDLAEQRRKIHMLHGVVRVLAQLHSGKQTEQSAEEAWDWLEAHRGWTTKKMYQYLTHLMAPRRCVDKSPTYGAKTQHLKRLFETFPNAYFLHMSRHPRSTGKSLFQVYSAKAAWGRVKSAYDSPMAVEDHWISVHKTIMKFTSQLPPGQSMRLQGEQLLSDPETYLGQIAEWLGIRTDSEAIEAMKHPEDSPFSCFGPSSARYGNNLGFLEKPKLRVGGLPSARLDGPLEWLEDEGEFSRETVELARQFGYQ